MDAGSMVWRLREREVCFPRRTLVMGIVNVNDDSFSGDGTLDVAASLERARRQIESGADLVDVGAESARTNRKAVAVAEECRRFEGFLDGWERVVAAARPRDEAQLWPPVLSANSWRPEVVARVLPRGVELLNDIGGLPDGRNARLCAEHGVSLLIMHTVGAPKVAHDDQRWDDVMASMEGFFEERIARARSAGMEEERLVLDPGIDFAKSGEDNLRVMRELGRLRRFGRPLLMPLSRKTVIGEVLGIEEPRERDAGTIGCVAAAVRRGAAIVRVHEVGAAWGAVKVLGAVGGG